MFRALLSLGLVLISPVLHAGEAHAFRFFLGERVAMVPIDEKVSGDSLPSGSLRAEAGKDGVVVVTECDLRNLPKDLDGAPPFVLSLVLVAAKEGEVLKIDLPGSWQGGVMKPVLKKGEAEKIQGVTATLTVRDTGVGRVTILLPKALVESLVDNKEDPDLRMDALWRLPSEKEGKILWPKSAVVAVSQEGVPARLVPRSPRATDIPEMLEAFRRSETSPCRRRAFFRLVRLCEREPELRGALVLALEHEDPETRKAAIDVWSQWPDDGQEDTEGLRARAREERTKAGEASAKGSE